jgi:hypothetical protein
MEPIISPWIIYAVNFAAKISVIATIAAFIIGTAMTLACFLFFLEDSKSAGSFLKKAWIPFAACVAIIIFIPDKETLMTMIAVQYVTPDNISAVQGNIVDFVGQIAQAVKDVK